MTEDEFITALRSIHSPEMFGDCVEDGDPYPCATLRLVEMYQPSPTPG
jgi:hypothetical protein